MKSTLTSMICRFMVIAMMMLPFQTGQASMIGADQANSAATSATAQLDRDVVVSFLSRAQTAEQFQSLGLDAQAAMDRVAAMTDAEVSELAGKVNAVPAGGDGLILLIFVVFFIWYFAFRR